MTNETKPTAKRKQPTIMIRPSQVREALATGDIAALIRLAIVFLAAVAALDCIIALLKAHKRLFAALRAGIKGTWRNVFSRIREVLYELPCAFGRLM